MKSHILKEDIVRCLEQGCSPHQHEAAASPLDGLLGLQMLQIVCRLFIDGQDVVPHGQTPIRCTPTSGHLRGQETAINLPEMNVK